MTLSALMMGAIAQNAVAASGDEGIALVRKERVDKFNAGKIEALLALHSADAVLLTGKGERFEGPSAIIDYLRTIHGQANDLKLTVDKFGSCGDLGYDSGSFQNSVTRDDQNLRIFYPSPWQREIPRIAALHGIGSAAIRAVIDLHHAISPNRYILEGLATFVFRSKRRRGRYSRNFPARASFKSCRLGPQRCESPVGFYYWFAFAEKGYTHQRRQSDVGFISLGRRTDELDLNMDWSEYTTGYTTSAEYPSIRAHSRAGPAVE